MKLKIIIDSKKRPDLFKWFGKINPQQLGSWLAEKQFLIPADLFEFFCQTGGGDIFETETILGPFGNKELGDDLEGMNMFHRKKGMQSKYLIFHIGLGISVIDQNSFHYLILDNNYSKVNTFDSFDNWYVNYLRAEYAERYGLS
jgi:hypothetical protein